MYAYASVLDVTVDTPRPRPNLRNRYQRQRAQLMSQPRQSALRVQRAMQPPLYYHPSRPNIMLEHIPLSDPRHPLWTGDPPPRRHSIPSTPYPDLHQRQRSRSEVARDRALDLAMELDPVRELRDARWARRQRTSSASGLSASDSVRQERRRRSRATRWPSSGSVRTVSTMASEDEAALWRNTPSAMSANPRPASTPEISLSTPVPNRRETLTLRHVPHELAVSTSSSTSTSSRTTRRAPSFSQRLRRRRSTFTLRSRSTFSSLRRRASGLSFRRTKSKLRDRRSTFSLRARGRRHTLSTARAAAAHHFHRARSELETRFAPGRVQMPTTTPSIGPAAQGRDSVGSDHETPTASGVGVGGGAGSLGRRLSRQLSRWNFGNPIPSTLKWGQGQRGRQGEGYDTDVQHVEHSLEGFEVGGGMSL